MCLSVTGGCVSKQCNGVDVLVRLPLEGISRRIHSTGRRWLCFLPGTVLVGKKGIENFPWFIGHQLFIPETTVVRKIPGGEDDVICGGGYFLRGVSYFSGINKIDGHLNLVNNGLKRLVDIVRGGHAGGVLL